ncbi:hypothetical protein QJS10_CPB13g01435 [Acorus calamus]|uniref:Uncharacterized protein n=1 Tax=Acorus calamus TaxID=4465 RepID=A0AAV9DIL3_ACOCL|nr:hypothetical protein QJS10_CPB13g01435 [Acorus calamus]
MFYFLFLLVWFWLFRMTMAHVRGRKQNVLFFYLFGVPKHIYLVFCSHTIYVLVLLLLY